MGMSFDARFGALTGSARKPFPWQRELFRSLVSGEVPSTCDIPTGLGKTSVIALWLLARAEGAKLPRRLVYVVNRRTVVDQASAEVERLRANLVAAQISDRLEISTLRGQMADNRAWSADPSKPAVICGTVDMIGSRLLFSGYRIGFKTRPLHAGFLGQDSLLVHDEAHLEPAFQTLLEAIQKEQRASRDPWPVRVMALTATPRPGPKPFRLTPKDEADPEVAKRLRARKRLSLHLHGDKDLVDLVVAQVQHFAASGRAVLVFLRTVEDVTKAVEGIRKAGLAVEQLTGTMRGYERERLMTTDVVQRFLPDGFEAAPAKTAVLVCTSAGEVGVNLSADHLVCDLSTFDSMAQRFGRVNRFGKRDDTEVHVFHPAPSRLEDGDGLDERRLKTLRLLEDLRGNASPSGLGKLDAERRLAAFAPEPTILPASDILFDAWAMTSIVGRLPGRPQVEPYLHGVAEWEPPTTKVAWRDEVEQVTGERLKEYPARELLDDYPLKPHELLSDRTSRVFYTLGAIAQREPSTRPMPVWVVSEDGEVETTTLGQLTSGDRKQREEELKDSTVLLSPKCCRPMNGSFTAEGALVSGGAGDVADEWVGVDDHNAQRPLRARVLGGEGAPMGMRLIRTVWLEEPSDDGERDDGSAPVPWRWYEVPRGGDSEGTFTATRPVLLEVHSSDVEREAQGIVDRLGLEAQLGKAIVLAAKLHDLGKARRVWQCSVGNAKGGVILAKSGGRVAPHELTRYRHELGSVLDAERDHLLDGLSADGKELALHLIAAHHGRGRPHFPEDELFDPEAAGIDFGEVGLRMVERFAALQKKYGRWGLAYLESLVRAADYAASANPSEFLGKEP